jgi:hypothetical protein
VCSVSTVRCSWCLPEASLKNLAREVLGRQIKQGRVSSVKDAVATMEVYRKAKAEIDKEQGN